MTRFRSVTFKLTNRGHPNVGSICEFLLSPITEASGRSAMFIFVNGVSQDEILRPPRDRRTME